MAEKRSIWAEGKESGPPVAIMDMDKYQRLLEEREEALQAVRSTWNKMEGVDAEEVEEIIKKAIQATRKIKATPKS
jgi:hypothetical protein